MKQNGLTRRSFLRSSGAAAVALGTVSANAIPQRQPLARVLGAKPRNVVFILSDDHRFDFMGFLGKVKFLETPNMDRMAREGAHIRTLSSRRRCARLAGRRS
jgi:hypothetical protein